MAENREIGDALLKENGLQREEPPKPDRQVVQEALAKERRRVARIKSVARLLWLATIAWPILALLACIVYPMFQQQDQSPRHSITLGSLTVLGWCVLGPAALICTLLSHMSSRTLSARQIQESLADISRQLQEMLKSKRD